MIDFCREVIEYALNGAVQIGHIVDGVISIDLYQGTHDSVCPQNIPKVEDHANPFDDIGKSRFNGIEHRVNQVDQVIHTLDHEMINVAGYSEQAIQSIRPHLNNGLI